MRKKAGFIICLMIMIVPQIFAGNVYYVDASNGNDNNSGAFPDQAWKTVGKINYEMQSGIISSGDDILFKRGETFTDDDLWIQVGGNSDDYMIIGDYGSGGLPTFDNGACIILKEGTSYVKIQNIKVQNTTGNDAGFYLARPRLLQSTNIQVLNCIAYNTAGAGIFVQGIDTFKIDGCIVDGCGNAGILVYGSENYAASNGIISNNIARNITNEDGISIHRDMDGYHSGPNHIIINNDCYNNQENGIDINGGSQITIEGNFLHDNLEPDLLLTLCSDVTIKRNYIYSGNHHAIYMNSGSSLTFENNIVYDPKYCGLELAATDALTSVIVYNNTFVSTSRSERSTIRVSEDTSGFIARNNVIMSTASGTPGLIYFLPPANPTNSNCNFSHNVWWRPDGNPTIPNELLDQGSLISDPQLVNPESGDFHLQSYSPCIDTGLDLGISSDFEGNTIPQGFAPDIGAYEYKGSTSPLNAYIDASHTSGYAPMTVDFAASVNGGTSPYSYSWNFGDGGSSSLQNPSHTYSNAGTYSVTLTVTDSKSGQASDSLNITVSESNSAQANLTISSATGSPSPGKGGTTNPSPGNHSYSSGSSIQIQAIPNANYRFSKWTGDISESQASNNEISITMENDKSITAHFYTKCGDVNGDLSISPADAQKAFDIFLGRISNPTDSEKENADVNCDGTNTAPNITPADAHAIFEKFIGKNELPCDCSYKSRSATLSSQTRQSGEVNLIINDLQFRTRGEIIIPINVDSGFQVNAFGLDFLYPSEILEFVGTERTTFSDVFYQADAYKIAEGMVRVGGYRGQSTMNPSPLLLIKLVFRVIGEPEGPISFDIINTLDDIKNASIKYEMLIEKTERSRYKIVKKLFP